MKKKILAAVFAVLTVLALTSCSDGKCDNCGAEAIENDEALSGVKGEYCMKCMLEEMGEAAADLLS